MIGKAKVFIVLAIGGALLSPAGRARLAQAPDAAQEALRRRRQKLPRGVEEFPTTMVDKRHLQPAAATPTAHAETSVEVVAEYYEQHPSTS